MSTLVTAYRLYIMIGNVRYYANRSDDLPTKRHVNWLPFSEEYPDTFSREEAVQVIEFYLDQQVRAERLVLQDADEDRY